MRLLLLTAAAVALALAGCEESLPRPAKPGMKKYRLPSGEEVWCGKERIFHGELNLWQCHGGKEYRVVAGVEVLE